MESNNCSTDFHQMKQVKKKKKKKTCLTNSELFCVSGHPNMGGPMQRMTPPRGMVPLGPQVWDQVICGDIYKA